MHFYIYLLYSESSDKYYVGYSRDPLKRLTEHNTVDHPTFTSKHRPWHLKAIFEAGKTKSNAIEMERFIKKQKSRKLLESLADPQFQPTGILAQLIRVPHMRD